MQNRNVFEHSLAFPQFRRRQAIRLRAEPEALFGRGKTHKKPSHPQSKCSMLGRIGRRMRARTGREMWLVKRQNIWACVHMWEPPNCWFPFGFPQQSTHPDTDLLDLHGFHCILSLSLSVFSRPRQLPNRVTRSPDPASLVMLRFQFSKKSLTSR